MKKIIALALVLLCFAGCFASCGQNKKENEFVIGICNYADDASLNQIVDNIQSRLAELGQEKNVTFTVKLQNGQADSNVMNQIIENFKNDKVDLMIGVATPVAMAMQAATENSGIPVVFSAVSDPVSAGLVEALDKPGENITGTSDFLDATAVMNLMFAANPEIQKVGLLYDVGQDSSKTAIETAKSYLQSKGVTVVEKTGRTNDELIQAAQNLVAEKVEAIFTPTDNTVMKAELAIYEILADAKIPHYTGADSFALNGAFLGYGVDYANLGKETANMVCEILVDKKPVSSMNVRTFDNGTATINTEICEKLGYNFEELKTIFAPYCAKVQSITTAEEFEK